MNWKFKSIKGSLFITLIGLMFIFMVNPINAEDLGVEYSTHVENIGWQDYVSNGALSGTTGKGLRLEAIKIRLVNPTGDLGVAYRTHIQDIGWADYVTNDAESGTSGQSKRLEAISIRLEGAEAPNYNIFYKVHAENYGWLGWAKNGEDAGTSKMGLRLEGIEIIVQPVTELAPDSYGQPSYVEGVDKPTPEEQKSSSPLFFRSFVLNGGWNPWADNGLETGSPAGYYLEAIQVGLGNNFYNDGNIQYRIHNQTGWSGWAKNEEIVGGGTGPIQAMRMRLTGKLQSLYDIYYRLYCPQTGWTNWAKNGQACGSEGFNRGITAIGATLLPKGMIPGSVGNAFAQGPWYWPLDNYHSLSTYFGPNAGSHHDGIDIPAPGGTPVHNCKSGIVRMAQYDDGWDHGVLYGAFGNCIVVETDSGEMIYYGHLSAFNTTVGARVNKGDIIGFVGTTGNSLGNHLHLEVYDSGDELVDPLRFF